jgi:uncharacterized coiled-coil DUF342 family protein
LKDIKRCSEVDYQVSEWKNKLNEAVLKIDELNDEIKVKDNTIESQYKDLQSKIEQIDNLMKEVENQYNKGNLVINATE